MALDQEQIEVLKWLKDGHFLTLETKHGLYVQKSCGTSTVSYYIGGEDYEKLLRLGFIRGYDIQMGGLLVRYTITKAGRKALEGE